MYGEIWFIFIWKLNKKSNYFEFANFSNHLLLYFLHDKLIKIKIHLKKISTDWYIIINPLIYNLKLYIYKNYLRYSISLLIRFTITIWTNNIFMSIRLKDIDSAFII